MEISNGSFPKQEIKHPTEPLPDLGGEDEDLVVATQKQTFKCPITTADLTSPIYTR